MSSYTHGEFELGLKVLATAAEKTFWLSTQSDGTRDWGYHDESAPPTQSEVEAQIIEAVNVEHWADVRRKRSGKLFASDWTQGADCPLTPAKKAEWATYRQSLRDVTSQSDPLNITWPTEPS
jgi:hypothetical protein|tara:strand:+ start:292 stop:657 length:366 start_codon:yes stop_codon:yes gene_type:complete